MISSELCNNIIGGIVAGVVTSALVAGIAVVWRMIREQRIKEFADLMGVIIEHRNIGREPVPDSAEWVKKARRLEKDAETKGYRVSYASGALIKWLSEFEEFPVHPEVGDQEQRDYVSLLTKVIERMRESLQRHDR